MSVLVSDVNTSEVADAETMEGTKECPGIIPQAVDVSSSHHTYMGAYVG